MAFFGQTQVQNQPAQAVAGDRASQNAIMTYDAGPGGLVAGPAGVVVGKFAWVTPPTDPNGTNQIANSFGSGNVAGFVYNVTQALDTIFLSDAGMTIPQGLPVALSVQGDWWVINNGTTEAQVGQKAYADFATGNASFAATGSPAAAASATGSTITPEINSWVGSIAGDILTVTGSVVGSIYPGTTIAGGVGVAPGTQIVAQLTPLLAGEALNGIGRYNLSVSQQKNIASEAMNGTYGLLTIGMLTTTPTFGVGQVLTASGAVVAGTQITANVTGAGGSGGTMVVNNNTNVGSQTIASVSNVETKWQAASAGGPGQLVKITSWVGSQG
jgi:hypothetical protein